jgi:hypothetical protein
MPPHPSIRPHDTPCPHCGYDLRASPHTPAGIRCPECGAVTPLAGPGGLTASRIPWVHRRWRGRFRAFAQTLWLVLARPTLLAREVEIPARPRDARRFRLICCLLASVSATIAIMAAMAAWKSKGWWVPPPFRFPLLIPSYILQDHWYGALPLAVGIFAANWLCLDLFAWIITLGSGPGTPTVPHYLRRRLAGLSHYSAALLLVESVFMSLLWNFWVFLGEEGKGDSTAVFFTLSLATLAAGIYLWASLPLVLRTGRWRALRALLLGFFPVVAYFLWLTIVTAINWTVGFLVLGIRSMTS